MSHKTIANVKSELSELIYWIDKLKEVKRYSAQHSEWLMRTLSLLENVFGNNSKYYKSFASLPWEKTGSMLVGGLLDPYGPDIRGSIEHQHQEAYKEQLESARGVFNAALVELDRTDDIEELYNGKDTPSETSLIVKVINLVEYKLRKVIRDAPAREVEVQEAIESLFIGSDLPYSREIDHIEYSSKSYIPDFIIERINLAIDVKLCAREGREKEIISEINDDILAYQTKYVNLLFVVYDVGFIRDVDKFISSFEKNAGVVVKVVKH